MEKFICLGDVRKGLSLATVRVKYRIPDSVTVVFGLPKDYARMTSQQIAFSIYWGVWAPKEQLDNLKPEDILHSPSQLWLSLIISLLVLFFFTFLYCPSVQCRVCLALLLVAILVGSLIARKFIAKKCCLRSI
jgi:hypothetical protein